MTQVTGVAESALLVPVGAALEVRDRVVSAIQPWTRRTSAEREIARVRRDVRRFERRGTVARNRVVRELRKRRNRVVRELRKRRGQALRVARVRRNGAQRSIAQNSRRTTAPRRPRRHPGRPGGPAAGEPGPEGASGPDQAGTGPRAAVRLVRHGFRLHRAAGQVLPATYGPLVHADRKQEKSNLSSLSRRAPSGARRSFAAPLSREGSFGGGRPPPPPPGGEGSARKSGAGRRVDPFFRRPDGRRERPPNYARPSASYSRKNPSNSRLWPCSSRWMSITMSCVTRSKPSQNSMICW